MEIKSMTDKADPFAFKRVFMAMSIRQQETAIRKFFPGTVAIKMKGRRRYFIDKVLTFNLGEMKYWMPPRGVEQIYQVMNKKVSKRDIQAYLDLRVRLKEIVDELCA